MFGSKIKLLKSSLRFIAKTLRPYDRLSIIEFGVTSVVHCGLRHKNEQLFNDIIDRLHANGETYIDKGLRDAFELLHNTPDHNPVTTILLLTDGQETYKGSTMKIAQQVFSKKPSFILHTFGYGDDHDSKLCSELATVGRGIFTYVKDITKLGESFATCLGGVISVVAQDISLNFHAPRARKNIPRIWCGDVEEFKVMTQFENVNKLNTQSTDFCTIVKIPNIYAGEQRNIVIDMTLAMNRFDDDGSVKSKNHCSLLDVSLTYSPGDGTDIITMEDIATITVNRYDTDSFNNVNVVVEPIVLAHLYRVQSVDVIDNAIKLATEGSYTKAMHVLQHMVHIINTSKVKHHPICMAIMQDFKECMKYVQPLAWKKDHGAFLLSSSQVVSQERCVGNQTKSSVLYRTSIQKDTQDVYEQTESHPIENENSDNDNNNNDDDDDDDNNGEIPSSQFYDIVSDGDDEIEDVMSYPLTKRIKKEYDDQNLSLK